MEVSGEGAVEAAYETGHERRIADRYRLTDVIGSGGGGTVWTAVDEVLGREVAIKDVVVPPWLDEPERDLVRERTLREARAACRIDHPNVVDIYDVVEEDDRPWIVMRLVRAPSLAQLIDRDGPIRPSQAARIGLQVLGALRAAHAHGITHRDVKPSNVLVNGDRAVLTDFGIATIAGEASLTSPDALVGAPSYIAPERVSGAPATAASDLWSFGATLYAAVEGHPPHPREGVLAILTAIANEDPEPPVHAGFLAPLLTAVLSRDPARRPSPADIELFLRRVVSLTDDSGDLTEAVAPIEAAVTTTVGQLELERTTVNDRPAKRRTPLVVGAATLTALAGLIGVLLLLPGSQPRVPDRVDQPVGEAPPGQVPGEVSESEAAGPRGTQGARDAQRPSSSTIEAPAVPAGVQPSQQPMPTTQQPTAAPSRSRPDPTTITTTTEEPPSSTTNEPPPTTAGSSETALPE